MFASVKNEANEDFYIGGKPLLELSFMKIFLATMYRTLRMGGQYRPELYWD